MSLRVTRLASRRTMPHASSRSVDSASRKPERDQRHGSYHEYSFTSGDAPHAVIVTSQPWPHLPRSLRVGLLALLVWAALPGRWSCRKCRRGSGVKGRANPCRIGGARRSQELADARSGHLARSSTSAQAQGAPDLGLLVGAGDGPGDHAPTYAGSGCFRALFLPVLLVAANPWPWPSCPGANRSLHLLGGC